MRLLFFFGFLFMQAQAAPPLAGKKSSSIQIKTCVRPLDLSNSKAIKLYYECQAKIEKLCEGNSHRKECIAFQKNKGFAQRFPTNPDDINPAERCRISVDGSYKCVQDPLKLVFKDEVRNTKPSGASASATPDGSSKSDQEFENPPAAATPAPAASGAPIPLAPPSGLQ